MAQTPLAELKESAASGAIAEIYADIRHAMGVPMVNLIFRHMATVPGCLEWAWAQLAPLYVSGRVAEAAAALTADPGIQIALSFDRADLERQGVGPAALGDIVRTCATYARANPMNLLGLDVLHMLLTETAIARARRKPARGVQPRPAPADLPPLPPMGDLAALTQPDRERLARLAHQLHQGDNGVIPSLYRHFTPWPAFLDALHAAVGTTIESGRLIAAANALVRNAHGAARLLYLDCPAIRMDAPSPDAIAALNGVLGTFPANIARMTIVARGVVAALAQEPPP